MSALAARFRLRLLQLVIWLPSWSVLSAGVAWAQEDIDESMRPIQADLEEVAEATPSNMDIDYTLGIYGEAYMQGGSLGVLTDIGGSLEWQLGDHELEVEADYLYDPFSTKPFNFTEETPAETSARIVQWMHELGGGVAWRSDWERWLATKLDLEATYRWTELPSDQRFLLVLGGELRLGADWNDRGLYAELDGDYFRRIYPRYRVADRSLDQQGTDWQLEAGYSFGRAGEVGVAYEFRLTDYFDARYQELDPGGQIVRADESKLYVRHGLIVDGVLRPTARTRIGLRYTFQRNDSRNYDRRMTGRDGSGNLDPRFIRDYFDYDRHWVKASFVWRAPFGLRLEAYAGYWLRLFSTYIARDTDNRWLDETRRDHNFDSGLELTYELYEVGGHRFNLALVASHLFRRSNMEREVSFAANFDVTRVFLGVEVHN